MRIKRLCVLGMATWGIWISELQKRMTLAVSMEKHDVRSA